MSLLSRRSFLQQSAVAALAAAASPSAFAAEDPSLIVDTHQHLWDLDNLKLPWLAGAPEILRHTYGPTEYAVATKGLRMRAIYMEVDVDATMHDREADYVIGLCKSGKVPTEAAVLGGRPASPDFGAYLDRHREGGYLKGVRQVLHGGETPRGTCLKDEFVAGVRLLGKKGLKFDLCLRPTELADGLKLTELCPDTQFVLDHCGNADVVAFSGGKGSHEPNQWRKDIDALSKRPNLICKISGIVARAPEGWKPADLAPIVNHCLDAFGPDRVVFGGDWPVCLLGSPLQGWVSALAEIIAKRPQAEREKLWSGNAIRHYGLKA